MADSLGSMNRTNLVCKVYETSLKTITSQLFFSRREFKVPSILLAHAIQVITRKVRETQSLRNTFLIWIRLMASFFMQEHCSYTRSRRQARYLWSSITRSLDCRWSKLGPRSFLLEMEQDRGKYYSLLLRHNYKDRGTPEEIYRKYG